MESPDSIGAIKGVSLFTFFAELYYTPSFKEMEGLLANNLAERMSSIQERIQKVYFRARLQEICFLNSPSLAIGKEKFSSGLLKRPVGEKTHKCKRKLCKQWITPKPH